MSTWGSFIRDVRRRRVLANAALYIVAAWVAIQVADLAIDAGVIRLALRDVFVAAFLGFPIALIVSWFYDFTRHGLVRTPPADAEASFDTSPRPKDYLLFAALFVIWGATVIVVHTPIPIERSIAILPFENPTHDPGNAIFAFGIRDDLQTQLQNLHDMKVIARESADQVDRELPFPDMGLRLGAAYIMRGSVERVLDRVRVSVTLVDAEKDQQTWAASYDRELNASNWFDIRDEISSAITRTLQAQLSPAEAQRLQLEPTENLEALRAYYRGRQRLAKRHTEALDEAVDYFQRAVELDAKFALAWVGLADSTYLRMVYRSLDEEEELSKMEAAVNRALQLDGQLGEAHATLAVLLGMQGDDQASLEAFEHALELSPNYAQAYQWYGTTLARIGRENEALVQKRKARVLDPLSAPVNFSIGVTLKNMGRFEEALEQFHDTLAIDPGFPGAYERIADIYHYVLGRLDEAVVWQTRGIAADPGEPMGSMFLAVIYLDLGDTETAQFWVQRAISLMPPGFPAHMFMEPVYLRRGDAELALEAAHKNLEMAPNLPYTVFHVRNRELAAGRYAEARALYERGYPALFEDDPQHYDVQTATDLAGILVRTDEQEHAEILMHYVLDAKPDDPQQRLGREGYGISDARIYSLQGQPRKALAALREAIDTGWRGNWWLYLEHDANLDSIRDEPEFQTMLEELRADMAAQLARVQEMQAQGEIAVVPDPPPEPNTTS